MSLAKLQAALDLSFARAPSKTSAPPRPVQDEVLFLFDACAPRLLRYVKSLGIEAAAAQDIVQETFIALFRHLRMDRPRQNLNGWLFRVAHNLALKHRRKSTALRTDLVYDSALIELVIDPSLDPEERLLEDRRQLRLRAVLQALPERDRQCLHLRAEGLRYREIAGVLGISLGSVAKSVTRSLARLANV